MKPVNLADPEFEPTDQDLQDLATRAFANVRAENERSLERLRAEIARAREEALREFAKRHGPGKP